MASCTLGFLEGQAINRPPLLMGGNYPYWKCRMKIFIKAQHRLLWKVIEDGPFVIHKDENNYTEDDWKKLDLNEVAMNILYCGLSENDFNRICTCTTAKQIWDELENTHEGTSRVRDTKISLLCGQFENFKMEPHESIDEMHNRFINIINPLSVLGKNFTNVELNSKILRSLPRDWEAKRTAIEEAHDLSQLSKEELLGTLKTHEMIKKQGEESKRKSIALKASYDESSENESDEDDDEEMNKIERSFMKFMKFNKKLKKKDEVGQPSRRTREMKVVTCFKCHKPGHIQQYCPMLKKSFKGSKNDALMATWSDDDSSESDEDLCLVALDDEVKSISSNVDYDELSDMYDKLCKEMIKLDKKNRSMRDMMLCMNNEIVNFKGEYDKLKNSHNKLNEDNEFLRYENGKLKEEKEKLSKEHEELERNKYVDNKCMKELDEFKIENKLLKSSLEEANKTIAKFVEGEKKLNILLSQQAPTLDKRGIGNNGCGW